MWHCDKDAQNSYKKHTRGLEHTGKEATCAKLYGGGAHMSHIGFQLLLRGRQQDKDGKECMWDT